MKPYLISALAAILSSSAMAYDVKSGGKTSVKKRRRECLFSSCC
ncbi:probable thiol oxidoreductase with 2 cytochrome c heme-binding sites [Vibrio sp. JCM 19053]|nr:probable thiol oxidoreductase with 2 cytochrome c heme-binding sites [Vibrio sp. JCM 19053]